MKCIVCGEDAVALVKDEVVTVLKHVKDASPIVTPFYKGLCKEHFKEFKFQVCDATEIS